MMEPPATFRASLQRWVAESPGARGPLLREAARVLGLVAGRAWSAIPEAECERLWRAVVYGDYRDEAQFDAEIPF